MNELQRGETLFYKAGCMRADSNCPFEVSRSTSSLKTLVPLHGVWNLTASSFSSNLIVPLFSRLEDATCYNLI